MTDDINSPSDTQTTHRPLVSPAPNTAHGYPLQEIHWERPGGNWVGIQLVFYPQGWGVNYITTNTLFIISGSSYFPHLEVGVNYIHYRFIAPKNNYSEWYDSGSFYVMSKPLIQSPDIGKPIKEMRPTFSGKGHSGASIEVFKMGNPPTSISEAVTVQSNGQWEVEVNQDLPPGSNSILVQQTVTDYSPLNSQSYSYVVALPPEITTPANTATTGSKPTVSGKGYPGATLELLDSTGRVLETTTVDASGNWSTQLFRDLEAGSQQLKARQRFMGFTSSDFGPRHFNVMAPPSISAPPPDSTQGSTFTVSGTRLANTRVKVVRSGSGTVLGTVDRGSATSWSVQVTSLPGECAVTAKQFLENGDSSVYAEHISFTVRAMD